MSQITSASLQKIPLSYASCSIGCSPTHTLPNRLESISAAGFIAIELSFPDILEYANQILGRQIAPNNFAELLPVADEIRRLCKANNLSIMMLQPFSNFEGWRKGAVEREEAFARAAGWMEIMNVVGTDLLQVNLASHLHRQEC
jgi:sugar phosphate isomerase/epimerase